MSPLRALARAIRRCHLRLRISQLQALNARPDLWRHDSKLQRDLLEAKLSELRCELCVLEMQAGTQP